MALIPCEECGKQISELAAQCPGCGAPVAKKIDCIECGRTMSGLAQSCPECGAPAPRKDDFIKDIGDMAKNVTSRAKSTLEAGLRNNVDSRIQRFKLIAGGIYFSQILTIFFHVIPLLVGFVLTIVMKADAKDTWLASHFKYHIQTYRWSLILVVGLCFIILIVGFLFPGETQYGSRKSSIDDSLMAMFFTPYAILPWLLYRAIRGGLTLAKNEPIIKKNKMK